MELHIANVSAAQQVLITLAAIVQLFFQICKTHTGTCSYRSITDHILE